MDYAKESVKKHAEWRGKIEVIAKVPLVSPSRVWRSRRT